MNCRLWLDNYRWIAWLLVGMCWGGGSRAGWAQAQDGSWRSEELVRKAKQAMALGMLESWKQALQQAEDAYRKESLQIPLIRRHNVQLWIWLLWSRYYRVLGEFPPIVQVQSMEDKVALARYIAMFEKAVKTLQESKIYLKQYNQLFAKIMQRSRWQDQIYLQAAMSVLRDVEGDIRTGEVYLAFLQYALQHWGVRKKIEGRLSQMGQVIRRLQKTEVEAKVQAMLAQDRQRRVAQVMMVSQREYEVLYQRNVQRQRAGTVLLISGSAIAALGGVALIAGSVLLWEGQQSNSSFSAGEKQQRYDAGMGAAIGGGAVLVGGGILAIVGALMRPSSEAMERTTVQNHNKHIAWERDHPTQNR